MQSGVQSGGQNHCLSGDDYRRRKAWKWDDETKKCDPPNSPQVDDLMQSLGIESALAGSKLKDEDSCSVFVSRKRIYFRIGLAASLLSCVAGILTFFIPLVRSSESRAGEKSPQISHFFFLKRVTAF